MEFSDQVTFVLKNDKYLVLRNGKTIIADSINAKRISDDWIGGLYYPSLKLLCPATEVYSDLQSVPYQAIGDNLFSSQLAKDIQDKTEVLNSVFTLKVIKKESSSNIGPAETLEQLFTRMINEALQQNKLVDVSKFNLENLKGLKLVEKPKGNLRTRKVFEGYPFITNEPVDTMTREQFENSKIGVAIRVFNQLTSRSSP